MGKASKAQICKHCNVKHTNKADKSKCYAKQKRIQSIQEKIDRQNGQSQEEDKSEIPDESPDQIQNHDTTVKEKSRELSKIEKLQKFLAHQIMNTKKGEKYPQIIIDDDDDNQSIKSTQSYKKVNGLKQLKQKPKIFDEMSKQQMNKRLDLLKFLHHYFWVDAPRQQAQAKYRLRSFGYTEDQLKDIKARCHTITKQNMEFPDAMRKTRNSFTSRQNIDTKMASDSVRNLNDNQYNQKLYSDAQKVQFRVNQQINVAFRNKQIPIFKTTIPRRGLYRFKPINKMLGVSDEHQHEQNVFLSDSPIKDIFIPATDIYKRRLQFLLYFNLSARLLFNPIAVLQIFSNTLQMTPFKRTKFISKERNKAILTYGLQTFHINAIHANNRKLSQRKLDAYTKFFPMKFIKGPVLSEYQKAEQNCQFIYSTRSNRILSDYGIQTCRRIVFMNKGYQMNGMNGQLKGDLFIKQKQQEMTPQEQQMRQIRSNIPNLTLKKWDLYNLMFNDSDKLKSYSDYLNLQIPQLVKFEYFKMRQMSQRQINERFKSKQYKLKLKYKKYRQRRRFLWDQEQYIEFKQIQQLLNKKSAIQQKYQIKQKQYLSEDLRLKNIIDPVNNKSNELPSYMVRQFNQIVSQKMSEQISRDQIKCDNKWQKYDPSKFRKVDVKYGYTDDFTMNTYCQYEDQIQKQNFGFERCPKIQSYKDMQLSQQQQLEFDKKIKQSISCMEQLNKNPMTDHQLLNYLIIKDENKVQQMRYLERLTKKTHDQIYAKKEVSTLQNQRRKLQYQWIQHKRVYGFLPFQQFKLLKEVSDCTTSLNGDSQFDRQEENIFI